MAFAGIGLAAPTVVSLVPVTPAMPESMPAAEHQAGLDRAFFGLRAPWLERPSGRGVRVAIVDTGIDADHPDLAGSVVGWKDFVNGRPSPYDDNGHGTHVAGILAGHGHFEWDPFSPYWMTGETGVAPGVSLLVAKAMNAQGEGDDGTVAQAIRWALDPNGDGTGAGGAQVISLSLGLSPGATQNPYGPTAQAIAQAVRDGVVVVVAAGNDGSNTTSALSTQRGVLVVGALDAAGDVASFSNYGQNVDLVAPGTIVSAYPPDDNPSGALGGPYVGMEGTSMAVPVVAGVVALMMEADPPLGETSTQADLSGKVLQVDTILRETATPMPDPRAGAGTIDGYAALKAVDQGTDAWDYSFLIGAAAGSIAVVAGAGAVSWKLLTLRASRAVAAPPDAPPRRKRGQAT